MGRDLLRDRELADLAASCSVAAGVDLVRLLCEADDEELKLTDNAQPALLFMGVALARLLARRGVRASAAAGHSVGEYTALCVAEAITPEEAMKVVTQRGRAMATASPPGASSMLAVLGLDGRAVESALEGVAGVWPANYNTPTQTVVGGVSAALDDAGARLLAAGARRVVPLKVAAAFHTPIMSAAGVALRGALEGVAWRLPELPVAANVSGDLHGEEVATIPRALERQLSHPVRWSGCVATLSRLGCDTFYELGPRRTLTGMMRELAPASVAVSISSPGLAEQVQ
jgi:[acyl-carrier-protein] S-malonyltransferase